MKEGSVSNNQGRFLLLTGIWFPFHRGWSFLFLVWIWMWGLGWGNSFGQQQAKSRVGWVSLERNCWGRWATTPRKRRDHFLPGKAPINLSCVPGRTPQKLTAKNGFCWHFIDTLHLPPGAPGSP